MNSFASVVELPELDQLERTSRALDAVRTHARASIDAHLAGLILHQTDDALRLHRSSTELMGVLAGISIEPDQEILARLLGVQEASGTTRVESSLLIEVVERQDFDAAAWRSARLLAATRVQWEHVQALADSLGVGAGQAGSIPMSTRDLEALFTANEPQVYLSDTVAWLLAIDRPLELRVAAAAALKQGALRISAASVWEVATKYYAGKLPLSGGEDWLRSQIAAAEVVPITADIARLAGSLGRSGFHPDPGDRLVVATAMVMGDTIVTRDAKILEWAAHNGVPAIRC